MKRIRRSRRARRRRVRRVRRMRRRAQRRPAYDGGTAVKCHVFSDLTYNSTYYHGDVSVNWGSFTVASNNTLRLSSSAEYINFATLYKEYKLVGVKMRWVPISQVTSALNSYLQEAWYCSGVTILFSQTTAPNTILGSDYFQSFDPSKNFSKYINVSKYYRSIDQSWQPVGSSYNDAGSLFRVFATGYSNGNVLGRVHATYYVKFRGTNL